MYYYMKLMNYYILKGECAIYDGMNPEKVCASWALPLNKLAEVSLCKIHIADTCGFVPIPHKLFSGLVHAI